MLMLPLGVGMTGNSGKSSLPMAPLCCSLLRIVCCSLGVVDVDVVAAANGVTGGGAGNWGCNNWCFKIGGVDGIIMNFLGLDEGVRKSCA